MPLVSVVIPAYNAEATIVAAVDSVRAQTHREVEILVVDDGSTDATAERLSDYGDEITVVRKATNEGVSRARNTGIERARGRFIGFLDADDIWRPHKLELQLERLSASPEAGLCYCAVDRTDLELGFLFHQPAVEYEDYTRALLLWSSVLPAAPSTVVCRSEFLRRVGGFDPSLSQCADWDFLIRASLCTAFAGVDEALTVYRSHPDNMSSDIGLLERDTFAVLKKFYATTEAQRYRTIRRRVYSNHWMILSGSYLHGGRPRDAVRCAGRGVRLYPANLNRVLALPARRLAGRSGTPNLSPDVSSDRDYDDPMSWIRALARRLWGLVPTRIKQPYWTARYGAPPERQWLRAVMNRDVARTLHELGPVNLDVVEVSGDLYGGWPWRRRTVLDFPSFDLCAPPRQLEQFDLVICEQVLEHVANPIVAVRTLRRLCRADGHVLVSTPFLVRLHGHSGDYWRFTPAGLRHLLVTQGLDPVWVRSWGNRRVVRGNLGRWLPLRPWRSSRNEADVPIVVWALARPRDGDASDISSLPA